MKFANYFIKMEFRAWDLISLKSKINWKKGPGLGASFGMLIHWWHILVDFSLVHGSRLCRPRQNYFLSYYSCFQVSERLQNELNELRTEFDFGNNQGPQLHIEIMPESDESGGGTGSGKGFVTLQELRKYIMMAADEMSSTMKT